VKNQTIIILYVVVVVVVVVLVVLGEINVVVKLFVVGPFVRTEKAGVMSAMLADDIIELSVSQLSPGTNYTLLIYAENSFGRSPAAFTIYATTSGTV